MKTNNEWWSSLTLEEKERLASIIKGSAVYYPECTAVWNALGRKRQDEVRRHFKNANSLIAFFDSKPFGD